MCGEEVGRDPERQTDQQTNTVVCNGQDSRKQRQSDSEMNLHTGRWVDRTRGGYGQTPK